MRAAPIAWVLVVASSGFALVSAIVFLTSGEFTNAWLVASVIVYGLVVIGAVVLAALDRPARDAPEGAPAKASGPIGDPELVARDVVYRSTAGEAVRLTYRWPEGATETRHVAATIGEMHTHTEIETYIDALPPAAANGDVDAQVDRALAARSIDERPRAPAEEER